MTFKSTWIAKIKKLKNPFETNGHEFFYLQNRKVVFSSQEKEDIYKYFVCAILIPYQKEMVRNSFFETQF